MSAICIIPARGNSRRIPSKNKRPFHGKPIIAYSIAAAQESGLFGDVWVSTDDNEIGRIAQQYGAKWHPRSQSLSIDSVGTQHVMANVLRELYPKTGPGYACCLYPTAPMLDAFDLRSGFALLPGHPYAYVPGLYYWGQTDAFLTDVPLSHGFEVPFPEDWYIDINTMDDWSRAEKMYMALREGK